MNPVTITKKWVKNFVIDLNFCPFARRPFDADRIHYILEETSEPAKIVETIRTEMQLLLKTKQYETSLIILPNALSNFYDYLDFLEIANTLLLELALEGVFQIASFHPSYQFAGTQPEDVENYTNRSPYPMIHILRESSVSWAVAKHPNTDQIPDQNIARLQALGREAVKKRWNELTAKN